MKKVEKLRDGKTSTGNCKKKMDKFTIIKGYFCTLISETDKSSYQEIVMDMKFSKLTRLKLTSPSNISVSAL